MKKILLTRQRSDSERLVSTLKAAGLDPLIEPLLTIDILRDAAKQVTEPPDIIIATSRHGFVALDHSAVPRDAVVIVTGEESARKAKELGFFNVRSMDNARNIPAAIARLYPPTHKILYLSGRDVTLDLAAQLRKMNYDARRVISYVAHASKELSPATAAAMAKGEVGGVVFFSSRTVSIYARLVEHHGLGKQQNSITAFCLSEEVAREAKAVAFAAVRHPEKIDTQALLDQVISHFKAA